ncbi:MAG: cation transporter [Lachnospiraceae bacterium]|nr:cation transporter [Lachnospiraceae bacterium]
MITLLVKLFVKNPEDVRNPKVREHYGIVCGVFGIFLNILLFSFKYFVGVISGSIAITADAFNNLSDAGSSLVSIIGFKMAGQKPDMKHPFGHGRIEYLSGLIVSAAIIVMGYEILKDSVLKILHPEEITFSYITVIVLSVSILVKIYMALYNKKIGKKIDSSALLATSQDSLSDTISTLAVLISTLLFFAFHINIDAYCGIFVGIWIIIAGIKSANETISPLLGQAPSKEFVKSVEEIVTSYKEIIGIHDLIVHDYGPGRVMISLHAEVSNKGDINELHDVIDLAEVRLRNELNCHAVIHMDPIEVGNPLTDELKAIVKESAKKVDENISIHDFRVVRGTTHTNLIFDALVPFSVKLPDEEVVKEIQNEVWKVKPNHFCVVTVDRDYVSN